MSQTVLCFKCYTETFYITAKNKINILWQFLVKNLKVYFSFSSSILKNIVAPPSWARFPVKLICCLAFGSASHAYCLLKSIAIIL